MFFIKLKIADAYLIKPEKKFDLRGFFSRLYCKNIMKKKKINFNIKQCNLSFNKKLFTFRGLHFSSDIHKENKIIFVAHGAIENHMIDLRKKSKTYLKKIRLKLDSKKNHLLFIPTGCANGFLTLKENTLVHYYMDNFFSKKKKIYGGIRYNDPFFKIKMYHEPQVLTKKDKNFINFIKK